MVFQLRSSLIFSGSMIDEGRQQALERSARSLKRCSRNFILGEGSMPAALSISFHRYTQSCRNKDSAAFLRLMEEIRPGSARKLESTFPTLDPSACTVMTASCQGNSSWNDSNS